MIFRLRDFGPSTTDSSQRFQIITIYFRLKDKKLKNWTSTTFIFGAKAAPGYARAKAIIKYINEIAKLVNNDPETKDLLQVYFISNYNVSYAEKIVVAAQLFRADMQ